MPADPATLRALAARVIAGENTDDLNEYIFNATAPHGDGIKHRLWQDMNGKMRLPYGMFFRDLNAADALGLDALLVSGCGVRRHRVTGKAALFAPCGQSWAVSQINGVLGKSDLTGALTFNNTKPVPLLTGKVQSRLLDFEDLGPMIGLSSDNAPPAMAPWRCSASRAYCEQVGSKRQALPSQGLRKKR